MDIIETLTKSKHVATPTQIEALAHAYYESAGQATRADSTYLRCLIVGCQAKLGTGKRGKPPSVNTQLEVLAAVHTPFYAAVLKGVTTPDVEDTPGLTPEEARKRSLIRNSRSNFARTAKATLAAFVQGGGSLRALDADSTSKTALRQAVTAPEEEDKTLRQVQRAQSALLRAVKREAKADPGVAFDLLQAVIAALQEELQGLEVAPQTTTSVRKPAVASAHTRTRVGTPQLHRSA